MKIFANYGMRNSFKMLKNLVKYLLMIKIDTFSKNVKFQISLQKRGGDTQIYRYIAYL